VTSLAVIGWSVLSAAGDGPQALAAALAGHPGPRPGRDAPAWYQGPLPAGASAFAVDFDPRRDLGGKGTRFFDRVTGLALAACGQAISDSELQVDEGSRHRIGITLGTTAGSMKSACDYSRETLLQDRPYLVNPILFPNTVMNCAAGQAAIWYGLRGINATIASGQLAFLNVLRYCANALRRGYADVILAGAVEELTPHAAWASHLLGSPVPAGEGSAVFVMVPGTAARAAGRRVDAEVLSVAIGFCPGAAAGNGAPEALAGCVRRALAQAGVRPRDVALVATGDAGQADQAESDAVAAVLGAAAAERVLVKPVLGECQAAAGALQMAALLSLYREDPGRAGQVSLLTGRTSDGGVGAAVVKGWSRVGSDRC
jgi:3-oxoacyl-[acyl-carrier-protein] synthase II